MKSCANILGPQGMNPNDLGDALTFHIALPTSQSCHISSDVCQHPQDRLTQTLLQTQMMNLNELR